MPETETRNVAECRASECEIDLGASFMVGDRASDVAAGPRRRLPTRFYRSRLRRASLKPQVARSYRALDRRCG